MQGIHGCKGLLDIVAQLCWRDELCENLDIGKGGREMVRVVEKLQEESRNTNCRSSVRHEPRGTWQGSQ